MKSFAEVNVTVVGLGLMGGSLAGALRGGCREVIGVARRAETVEAALARGLVDRATTDLAGGVTRADVVVLATPVRTILRLLQEIAPLLPDGCLVTDLGSTKAEIVAGMARLPPRLEAVGGHPMCGREVSGVEAADPNLYRDHPFILCPLERTSAAAQSMIEALVAAIGARPLILDPARHDRLMAVVSHVPYLLACALTGIAEEAASVDPMVWDVAASGFRDTSRLAGSDVEMMLDILLTNRGNVLEAVEQLQSQLGRLADWLENGDEGALRAVLLEKRAISVGHARDVTHVRL